MRTVRTETNVYDFDELSDDSKEKALDECFDRSAVISF